jgi:ribonuclease BN (tRNA processing enzyme)
MKIRFLGAHNVETASTKLPGLLVDGVLALDAGSLTSALSIEEMIGLKAVLLTHQHYDHLRDMPMLGMNLFLNKKSTAIYGTVEVRDALTAHLMNGPLYPRFLEKATFDFYPIEPFKPFCAEGYDILPVTVDHSVPAVGYQVASGGRRLFYSGDTGTPLNEAWERVNPDLIVIETTASNNWTHFGREAGHLTPEMLKSELVSFKKMKGYLPPVYTVHMNPFLEKDIEVELKQVERELGCKITMAKEGMEITI